MITIININLTLRQHWPQITNTQTADSDDIINIIYRIDNTFLFIIQLVYPDKNLTRTA